MAECNHIIEVISIYDGGVMLSKQDGETQDLDYDWYRCKYCPECGEKLEENKT